MSSAKRPVAGDGDSFSGQKDQDAGVLGAKRRKSEIDAEEMQVW